MKLKKIAAPALAVLLLVGLLFYAGTQSFWGVFGNILPPVPQSPPPDTPTSTGAAETPLPTPTPSPEPGPLKVHQMNEEVIAKGVKYKVLSYDITRELPEGIEREELTKTIETQEEKHAVSGPFSYFIVNLEMEPEKGKDMDFNIAEVLAPYLIDSIGTSPKIVTHLDSDPEYYSLGDDLTSSKYYYMTLKGGQTTNMTVIYINENWPFQEMEKYENAKFYFSVGSSHTVSAGHNATEMDILKRENLVELGGLPEDFPAP